MFLDLHIRTNLVKITQSQNRKRRTHLFATGWRKRNHPRTRVNISWLINEDHQESQEFVEEVLEDLTELPERHEGTVLLTRKATMWRSTFRSSRGVQCCCAEAKPDASKLRQNRGGGQTTHTFHARADFSSSKRTTELDTRPLQRVRELRGAGRTANRRTPAGRVRSRCRWWG